MQAPATIHRAYLLKQSANQQLSLISGLLFIIAILIRGWLLDVKFLSHVRRFDW